MKIPKTIPSHYRQIQPHEVIRKGDLKLRNGVVRRVSNSVGRLVSTCSSLVYRRQHVPVGLSVQVAKVKSKTALVKEHSVEKNPLISFLYPHPVEKNPLLSFLYPRSGWRTDDKNCNKLRQVRLIAANDKYFIGLEVSDKNRFKKFLKQKATQVQVAEFNATAI